MVEDDPNCNFIPKQMTREQLRAGYWDLVTRLYTPEAFLERYFKVFESAEYLERRAEICRKAGEGKRLPTLAYGLAPCLVAVLALVWDGSLFSVGRVYAKYFFAQPAAPTYDRWLCAVHEPLRRPLAFLQVHVAEMTAGRLRATTRS